MTDHAPRLRFTSRRYRWLAVLPTVGLLGGIPFVDPTSPTLFGFPPLLVWIVAWAPTTSAIMGLILVLDRRHDK